MDQSREVIGKFKAQLGLLRDERDEALAQGEEARVVAVKQAMSAVFKGLKGSFDELEEDSVDKEYVTDRIREVIREVTVEQLTPPEEDDDDEQPEEGEEGSEGKTGEEQEAE